MKKKIEAVNLLSLLKSLPIVYAIMGFVIAILSYVYSKLNSDIILPRLGFFQWVLAILLYTFFFCLIFTGLSVLGGWLYNIFSRKTGAVEIDLSE